MTGPLPIPVGTLCVIIAASRPDLKGRLCTVLAHGQRHHPDNHRLVSCYEVELEDGPDGPWFCLPTAIRPLPPPPLSITLMASLETRP